MSINKTLTSVERSFNIAGSIPLVSVASSAIRGTAGSIQAITGLAIAALSLVGQMFSRKKEKVIFDQRINQGLEQAIHGGLNILRAMAEQAAAITVVGSLAFLGFQVLRPEGFDPIQKYNLRSPQIVYL